MNTMKRILMMSALLAASSSCFAALTLEVHNEGDKNLVVHFSKALADGKLSEDVNAGDREVLTPANDWLNNDVTVTWKNGEEVVDADTIRFTQPDEELKSVSNDTPTGDTDVLNHVPVAPPTTPVDTQASATFPTTEATAPVATAPVAQTQTEQAAATVAPAVTK